MKLTPAVEADHAQWIHEVLEKIFTDSGATMDELTEARLQSAYKHAEILKDSMASGAGA